MSHPNFILLYVDNPQHSARFYAPLLDKQPIESSPGFVMFALDSGMMLGLWSKNNVEPAVPKIPLGGSGELAFAVADIAAVKAMHTDWSQRGLQILQQPVRMDFGYTFTAADPDGHRLRVFAPSDPAL
ncbi:VOC family protein [Undibacterium terreum]|uniref:Drug:proton antiporter n=1 Tax=Undibacterium terreum TaxID=1224302 RepID=A0A916XML8_9BURK|nr:VOC family protein [Undibacterium terreum]GGC82900.1 drug:proton antiporter [Undibacterium terreum]